MFKNYHQVYGFILKIETQEDSLQVPCGLAWARVISLSP